MSKTLLLIDDDLAPMRYYIRALTEAGYAVQHKRNPDEAINFLDAGGCADLIILDVMMPGGKAFAHEKTDEGMTIGLFLLKVIRVRCPETPVLILTNLSTPEVGVDMLAGHKGVEIARKIETDPFDLVDRVRLLLDQQKE